MIFRMNSGGAACPTNDAAPKDTGVKLCAHKQVENAHGQVVGTSFSNPTMSDEGAVARNTCPFLICTHW